MGWKGCDIDHMEREDNFPFRLNRVYCCWQWTRPVGISIATPPELLEISVRLNCKVDKCRDELNGRSLDLPFPHVLVKRPGDEVMSTQPVPRDTIAFQYPAALQDQMKEFGLLPDRGAWPFTMTPAVESLLKDYWNCLYHLYTPGTPDQLDWLCFKLLWELSHQKRSPRDADERTVMRNASVWLQIHFSEKITAEDIAAQYHMSRATFYRAWERCFALSPIQYICDLRLQAAATLLAETRLPITRIVANVGFGGVDAFHRKFKQKYGLTPARYRESARQGVLPRGENAPPPETPGLQKPENVLH